MIIKKLIKGGICFSVMKSYSTLKKINNSERYSEYEIIALMQDFGELEEHGFQTNQNTKECPVNFLNPDGVISKVLSLQETKEFQSLINHFTEVYNHPTNGKVFELKNQSFKDIYSKSKF